MNKPCPQVKAKSGDQGGITLVDHTDHVLAAIVKIAESFGLGAEEKRIARLGAILHDIGKANPVFQKRLTSKPGLDEDIYRHEIGSLLFLPLFPKELHPPLIDMVVAHHRSVKKDGREQGLLDLERGYERKKRGGKLFEMHAGNWEEWQTDALEILDYFGVQIRPITSEEAFNALYNTIDYCHQKQNGWSFWKGLLVAADHLASSTNEKVYDVLKDAFKNPELSFYHQEDRKSELYPLSLINTLDPRPHTLVTAPTGAGKTDFLLRRTSGRVFYTLPFQASINAMHKRFRDDLKDTNTDIRILHAASRLVIGKKKFEERAIQDKAGASLKVLTPYQLASIAFGTRGYEAIMVDVQNCDIILDEIHTYTDISRAIVLKIVEVLRSLNCRIHIGTATMPSDLKKEIIKLLSKEQTFEVQLSPEQLDDFDRHVVHKVSGWDATDKIIQDAVNNKQKILIVCNRVASAQAIFSNLSGEYGDNVPSMLIHSRFTRNDRKCLEHELKEIYNENPGPCIVVSTQVVEVSLDISFDFMITEAAPLDSLVQRFGRINRERKNKRKREFKPIYVLAPPEDAKDALPYDLEIIQKSFDALPSGSPLKEREVQRLIDSVYVDLNTRSINLMAIFKDGEFLLKELWHRNKSVLIEQMDIETVTCILQSDHETYLTSDADTRSGFEIPVSYKSVGYRGLDQEKKKGTRPFIIPDKAYDEDLGLLINEAVPTNYKTFEII